MAESRIQSNNPLNMRIVPEQRRENVQKQISQIHRQIAEDRNRQYRQPMRHYDGDCRGTS